MVSQQCSPLILFHPCKPQGTALPRSKKYSVILYICKGKSFYCLLEGPLLPGSFLMCGFNVAICRLLHNVSKATKLGPEFLLNYILFQVLYYPHYSSLSAVYPVANAICFKLILKGTVIYIARAVLLSWAIIKKTYENWNICRTCSLAIFKHKYLHSLKIFCFKYHQAPVHDED